MWRRSAISVLCAGLFFSAGARGAVFTVVNTDVSGPSSLGQAILDANQLPGADEIAFAIPGSGVHVIDLSEQSLPVVAGALTIDGYTQPGASPNTLSVGSNAVILIQLDGGGPSSKNSTAIRLMGAESVVRGISVTGFSLTASDPDYPNGAIQSGPSFLFLDGNNRIEGNFVGLSPDGRVSGSYIGVVSTEGDQVGGVTPAQRNIIAGNQIGILSYFSGLIAGNYIGLDPSGLRQGYGNRCGIVARFGQDIGGASPGAGNVISNNDIGIDAEGPVFVAGNLIGPRADGSPGFGNRIGIRGRFSYNLIGGLSPGQGNVIAFNRKGVVVRKDPPPAPEVRNNRILSNSIYANSEIDIDLGDDGPTANDFRDTDAGANLLQNFPVLTAVTRTAVTTSVSGGVNSKASTAFTLQFFANGASRTVPQMLLGTEMVTTDSTGDARFEFSFPVATSDDQFITATATDPSGNTSEFFPSNGKVKLVNLSARGFVGTGDDVLIGGVIRSGIPATVLIRALGPSLPVSGALADPRLIVRSAGGIGAGAILVENDNWKSLQEQAIRNTGLAPSSDLEAAVLTTAFRDPFRDNGAFTVEVRGADGGTGLGVVEVYNLDDGVPSDLRNISTRGRVGTGEAVLIGGVIVDGSAAQKVIVRAIGPALAGAGVAAPLQDPMLELRDAQGNLLVENDDWRSDQEQEIVATGIAPHDDRESAIVMTLVPTAYTAIVRGRNNSTGIALVEFYKL